MSRFIKMMSGAAVLTCGLGTSAAAQERPPEFEAPLPAAQEETIPTTSGQPNLSVITDDVVQRLGSDPVVAEESRLRRSLEGALIGGAVTGVLIGAYFLVAGDSESGWQLLALPQVVAWAAIPGAVVGALIGAATYGDDDP